MNKRFLRTVVSGALIWVLIVGFWLTSAEGVTPTFKVYAKNGTAVSNHRVGDFLDSENSVRIGFDVRHDVRIGFDSKYGVGILIDF